MYSHSNAYLAFSGITTEEIAFLNQATAELDDQQKNRFLSIYSTKRKNPQDILLATLLGFVVVAGIQRFILGQTLMGVLYLLTGGFCFIGTVIDLMNHKSLTDEYNRKMAYESFQITKMYK
ncbi:MAG: TM2 domain-containing protein [Sphingobacteriaceae bacterium]|nr:MAG: TM2 domain-containing protein [Sphingobacteriaceae bacterium]